MTVREYISKITGYDWELSNRVIKAMKCFPRMGMKYLKYLAITFFVLVILMSFFSNFDDGDAVLQFFIYLLLIPPLGVIFNVLWSACNETRAARLLEIFISAPTDSKSMQEADKYLYDLLYADRIGERFFPKVKVARLSCLQDNLVVAEKVADYCRLLYEFDPEFAKKYNFVVSVNRKPVNKSVPSCKAAASADSAGAPAASSGTSGVSGSSRSSGVGASNTFYIPPSGNSEDDDSIALDMEEAIDDDIMFHGGNPFDWDTRSDYLDDPFGFGGDDGDGGEDW